MTHIIKGYGFHVGNDFARARTDTPIELAPKEYAKSGHATGGYIHISKENWLAIMGDLP